MRSLNKKITSKSGEIPSAGQRPVYAIQNIQALKGRYIFIPPFQGFVSYACVTRRDAPGY